MLAYIKHTSFYSLFYFIRFVKKVYFFESNPEPRVWEKLVEKIDDEYVSDSPWELHE
ncbi:hypothetical protein NADRNF5_1607 [Nitrosopumilus adriaticus]|uniref:Uncharacterized protein n=1 Tax=Nitrosopumilus adriaticus TaxID=1580092 RepID=A0A0D5C424_9ARCH|nr:hypothetical protein NADRNF5_1607 [Nitrosopumilus adriaticus]